MKNCPFCAEKIQDEAIKCRFCGELVSFFKDSEFKRYMIDDFLVKEIRPLIPLIVWIPHVFAHKISNALSKKLAVILAKNDRQKLMEFEKYTPEIIYKGVMEAISFPLEWCPMENDHAGRIAPRIMHNIYKRYNIGTEGNVTEKSLEERLEYNQMSKRFK